MNRPSWLPRKVKATILARTTIWIAGTFGIWQAGMIWSAEPSNFASASYAVVRQVPGGMDAWGWFAAMFGVLVIAGSVARQFWVKGAGIFGLSAWCSAFGFGSLKALHDSPNAGPTGAATYFCYSAAIAVLLIVDERRH